MIKIDCIVTRKNPFLERNDWDWPIDPIGLRIGLNELYDRYELPLFVVENGLGLDEYPDEKGQINDDKRIKFLKDHIIQLKKMQWMKTSLMLSGIRHGDQLILYLWVQVK